MKRRNVIIIICLVLVLGVSCAVAAGSTPGSDGDPLVSQSYVDAKTTYTPIQLTAGQSLIGKEGTEIILRSGEATAIGNTENGISDVTGGADLMTGTPVQLNHLLLTPRDDGRGIKAVTDIWVMVRGEYVVK